MQFYWKYTQEMMCVGADTCRLVWADPEELSSSPHIVTWFYSDAFLGNIIGQFQEMTGKSVNYPCFLHNYFELVSSECWPHKKEIMESIFHRLPKTLTIVRTQVFIHLVFIKTFPYLSNQIQP